MSSRAEPFNANVQFVYECDVTMRSSNCSEESLIKIKFHKKRDLVLKKMKQGNVNRWDLPGWKFEPGYSPRTLVGDWFEERKVFPRGNMSCVTSNMAEYQTCDSDFKSRDWRTMWNNRIVQQSGFGIKYLLDHHINDYVTRRLSTYNLEFGSPFRMETTKYQPRRWDRNTQRWVPEKMDLPISKNKTLYDTIQKMKTNLRDVAMERKSKQENAFVFPTPQDSSSKAPKLSYRHGDKERSRNMNIDKQQNLDISINV